MLYSMAYGMPVRLRAAGRRAVSRYKIQKHDQEKKNCHVTYLISLMLLSDAMKLEEETIKQSRLSDTNFNVKGKSAFKAGKRSSEMLKKLL